MNHAELTETSRTEFFACHFGHFWKFCGRPKNAPKSPKMARSETAPIDSASSLDTESYIMNTTATSEIFLKKRRAIFALREKSAKSRKFAHFCEFRPPGPIWPQNDPEHAVSIGKWSKLTTPTTFCTFGHFFALLLRFCLF